VIMIGDVDQSYQPPGNSTDNAQISSEMDESNQPGDFDSFDDLGWSGIDHPIGTGDSYHLSLPMYVFEDEASIEPEEFDLQIENLEAISLDGLLLMGDDQMQPNHMMASIYQSTIAVGTIETWENVIDATTWENWSYQDL